MSNEAAKTCTMLRDPKTPQVYRDALNQRDQSYERLGLYYVTRKNQRVNFCDVHFVWDSGMGGMQGWYSGPADSVTEIKSLTRSAKDGDAYLKSGAYAAQLDVNKGGTAYLAGGSWLTNIERGHANLCVETTEDGFCKKGKKVVYDAKEKKKLECWLIGPLLLNGNFHGALVLSLRGRFQKASGFQPCVPWSCVYEEGFKEMDYAEWKKVYFDQDRPGEMPGKMHPLQSVPVSEVHPDATRLEWTIEAYQQRITMCQAYASKG